ncbi:MAG: cytochrome c-type biogenesis protein CcmH [Deltaproteobacteria bacterium]|nr:cytochrome c-type biogenesis protein CcmH [Deltaproteobacteria bacterium]
MSISPGGRRSTCRNSQFLILLCLSLSVATASVASAAEEEEGWGYRLSHELMSPFCPGRTLSACSSPQAADVRVWIVEQEEAGRGEEEVKAQLYQEYGEVMRSAPLVKGGGQWAYIIPVLLILLGAGVVILFLKRQQSGAGPIAQEPAGDGPPVEEDHELARIVDQEMGSQ